jgi:hypothetical protein
MINDPRASELPIIDVLYTLTRHRIVMAYQSNVTCHNDLSSALGRSEMPKVGVVAHKVAGREMRSRIKHHQLFNKLLQLLFKHYHTQS